MNFGHLLNVAEKNRSLSTTVTSVKRYTTEVAPAKKPPKSNVQSAAVRAFLQRKEQEEKQKQLEELHKKEKLLELRAQNSKSNKRAKVMASRTKDNDFSRIRLTEEEEEARRKREMELHRKMLTDKVERMKARIALVQQEEGQPHKRKRRRLSASGEHLDSEVSTEQQKPHERKPRKRKYELYTGEEEPEEEEIKKQRPPTSRPPPPVVDYHDLLKIARVKQHEPVPIEKPVERQKEEWRPLTKQEKEKRLEEELHRKGVKLQSLPPIKKKPSAASSAERKTERGPRPNGKVPPPTTSSSKPPQSQLAKTVKSDREEVRRPERNGVVKQTPLEARVAQRGDELARRGDERRRELERRMLKAGMLKKPGEISLSRDVPVSKKVAAPGPSQIARSTPHATSSSKEKRREQEEDTYYAYSNRPKSAVPKPGTKPGLAQRKEMPSSSRLPPSGKLESRLQKPAATSSVPERRKLVEKSSKPVPKAESAPQKPRISPEELQRRREMALRMKRRLEERKKQESAPPPQQKKKSYEEQYEDLYRRLQGTQYIESEEEEEDEEYEDEEDDMDNFIDDGPMTDGLDYSKHIREIFGYDRRKFVGMDDEEEALESSYAQQMKEEVRSARIGLKEDIEDMKREEEELKRKQLRKLEAMRKMHRKLR